MKSIQPEAILTTVTDDATKLTLTQSGNYRVEIVTSGASVQIDQHRESLFESRFEAAS